MRAIRATQPVQFAVRIRDPYPVDRCDGALPLICRTAGRVEHWINSVSLKVLADKTGGALGRKDGCLENEPACARIAQRSTPSPWMPLHLFRRASPISPVCVTYHHYSDRSDGPEPWREVSTEQPLQFVDLWSIFPLQSLSKLGLNGGTGLINKIQSGHSLSCYSP
jgi:hypothetical protein